MNSWLKQAKTGLFVLLLFFSAPLSAHQTGNSYLVVTDANGRLHIDIDFIVRDLDSLLQNTAQASTQSPSSTPTPEQLKAKQAAITQIIQQSLVVEVNEQTQSWTSSNSRWCCTTMGCMYGNVSAARASLLQFDLWWCVMVFSTKTTSWDGPFSSCGWDKRKSHPSLIPARIPNGLPWASPSAWPPWVYSPKKVPCIFGVVLTISCFFSPCFCQV